MTKKGSGKQEFLIDALEASIRNFEGILDHCAAERNKRKARPGYEAEYYMIQARIEILEELLEKVKSEGVY